MNFLSWNCRGLGNSRAVRVLRDVVKTRKPDFLFLSETLVRSDKIKTLCSSLGFVHSFAVDCIGRSGGLAVMWRSTVVCTIDSYSVNHIDVLVLRDQIPQWRLTCFYGIPERSRRRDSWELIKQLSSTSTMPWCIFGDFNDLLFQSDKEGVHDHPQYLMDGFREAIVESGLTEIDLNGGRFTWERGKGTSNWVRERLDRAFASDNWWHFYPLCKLSVHHAVYSDHDPIQLELYNVSLTKKEFRFKFENTWLREPNFRGDVKGYWDSLPSLQLLPKLLSMSHFMAKWGRNFFHKFRDKLQKQKEIVSTLAEKTDEDSIKSYFLEKDKLHELLWHEECYWKQRAKTFWLAEGDANSKFFHNFASTRRKANFISKLQTEEGTVTNETDMHKVVLDYFRGVFGERDTRTLATEESTARLVTDEQNAVLTTEVSFDEFTKAVKQMHPDKASGPDGLNPAFFQQFWPSLGREVFETCKGWLNQCKFPNELNETNVVLIPKKENADRMTDLRPIALCNVLYKILAKVLANRLKVILPGIICENQSAFVSGRNITDNVLVAFEIIHHMKRKHSGGIGEVALKLDISKAYDRVDWDFLNARMHQMGFCSKWIQWIMLCVKTVNYSFCFNGSIIGPVKPKRGLRQGDPLSPYLFLFCVEGLSRAINQAEERKHIHGCKVSRSAPPVTHLLFADDSFLFFRADSAEANKVREVLDSYENSSGQAVNYNKSGVFFSSNVRRDKQLEIMNVLGVTNDLSTGNYLGLPSLVGKSKTAVFRFLKDRIWKRVQGWNVKLLSKAGKAVLLKNVATAIPSYSMSCFLLPKKLCQEIERILNGFWWSSSATTTKGIRWMAWDGLSNTKAKGGLDFRSLHGYNLAMLGKHVWNFIHKPQSLVARVFKARYYPKSHILNATRDGGSSFVWSGIFAAKEELKRGFKWVVGNGRDITVATDPWITGKDGFMVDAGSNIDSDMKVANLFDQNSAGWDRVKVEELFSERDAEAILRIRIPRVSTDDRVSWVHNKNGQYSVKSGYRMWQEINTQQLPHADSSGWRKIWKMQIPTKVKYFLWRFCRNNIPVRATLQRRHITVPLTCPMCNTDEEHLFHVFFDCEFASQCWQYAGLSFNFWEVEDVSTWLLNKLATDNSDQIITIAMVLWAIWFFRNKRVWEEKRVTPGFAVDWGLKQLHDWKQAVSQVQNLQQGHTTANNRENAKWVRPVQGKFKVNVDAGIAEGSNCFTIGMLLRDHTGFFLEGRTMKLNRTVSVMEAETTGIEEALLWITSRNITNICIESDSLLAVQAINGTGEFHSEVGHSINICRSILASRSDICVQHVRRLANRAAHCMARIPCELNSVMCVMNPPRNVLDSVMYDAYF